MNDTLPTASREREAAANQLPRSESDLAEAQRLSKTGSWAFTSGKVRWDDWSDELPRIILYLAITLLVGCAVTVIARWLAIHLGIGPIPFLLFVIAAAWFGGFAPGLMAAALATYAYRHYWLPPTGHTAELTVHFSAALITATLRRYSNSLRRRGDELKETVQNLLRTNEALITQGHAREQAENRLRRSQAYLAEAQQLSHTGSFGWDVSVGEIYWSSETFRIFECHPTEKVTVDLILQRTHPEDRKSAQQLFERVAQQRTAFDFEHRLLMPNGSVKYVHIVGRPSEDESGLLEFVGAVTDVSERKHAEEALRRSEAYLAEAQKLSHTGSWALDPATGKMVYYSEEMFRIMGLEPTVDPPDNEAIWERVHPEDLPPVKGGIELLMEACKASRTVVPGSPEHAALESELRASRPVDEYQLRVVHRDGTLRYLRSYGHPILDKTGKFVEWVGSTIDVTEQKQSEFERERLRQLEADLAHMNRISMMGELVASLTHDLTQPIAAAIADADTCLYLLTRSLPDVEGAREAATRAIKAGTHAAEIIGRLRSFYKKGALTQREIVDVAEIIEEITVLLRNEAARSSVSVHLELADRLIKAMADRVQLQQVLMNLMLNAIEAMQETGGALAVKSRLNPEGLFQISVSDTGPGLPATKENQIFEPFFTTKPQGTGMGLAICRSIVESHGGRLWAVSNGNRGACFHFTLPAANHYET